MAIEIEVNGDELDRIRKNRGLIEKRLRDVESLEKTLKALKMQILLERRQKLLQKLKEIEVHYRELREFEKKAREDREYMIELRRDLSRENEELRKRLEATR